MTEDNTIADGKNPVLPGRSCNDCAMCCMVMGVKELDKPKGVWCRHCTTRKACDIYDARPEECRTFYCGYLTLAELGEEWKPNRSKIVLASRKKENRITAHVDPRRPDAWRQEPYYATLKKWAKAAAPHKGQVIVSVGARAYMILPDRDVDLSVGGPADGGKD